MKVLNLLLHHSLSWLIDYLGYKIRLKFNGSCLTQPKTTYTHGKTVKNIYVVYELTSSSSNDNNHTVRNSLFGAVRLTKNADFDKYDYSGYGTGFDRRGSFSFPGCGFGSNVITFGVDMSSSVHVDNKKWHFNSWKRFNTRVRKYIDCKKKKEKKWIQLILLWLKRNFV